MIRRTIVALFGAVLLSAGTVEARGTQGAPLPPWVPGPGTFANISLNTLADVDPCPSRGCVYSGVSGQEAVFIVWNGGAFASDYSQYGALVVHGGGHNGYSGNEVYAFDLSTRLWVRVGSPSLFQEHQRNSNGEYPDGQPFPPHTYDGVAYLSAADGGGSKGSFLRFGFAGDTVTQWVHRMPLTTGPDTTGGWSRFSNSGLSGSSYYAVDYDPTRKRYWAIGTLNSWPNGFGYVSTSGAVTVLPDQGDNIGGDHVLGYCPPHDMLVHLAGGNHLAGRLCTGNAAFTKLNMTGPIPPANAGLEWSTLGGYFVSYAGNGSNTVHKLTPPATNPLTGTWVWSTVTLSGAGGAVPIKASGYGPGQWNGQYSRFREVPALSTPGNPTFVYADGRTQPVQLWRLSGTPPSGDLTPPTVTITSPAPGAAASDPAAIAGTASDANGVNTVTWSNAATGGSGTASGTTSWTANVPLATGSNTITITARDPSGNAGTATIMLNWAGTGGGGSGGGALSPSPARDGSNGVCGLLGLEPFLFCMAALMLRRWGRGSSAS